MCRLLSVRFDERVLAEFCLLFLASVVFKGETLNPAVSLSYQGYEWKLMNLQRIREKCWGEGVMYDGPWHYIEGEKRYSQVLPATESGLASHSLDIHSCLLLQVAKLAG